MGELKDDPVLLCRPGCIQCNWCVRLTDAEQQMAVAIQQLLGYSAEFNVNSDDQSGHSDQVNGANTGI